MDIAEYNARWLKAWSDKDVEGLLAFYSEDTRYVDAQVPTGAKGREAFGTYLRQLFAATPPMRYDPDEVWAIEGGYCGRWICTIEGPDGEQRFMRGFDLVLLDGDEITLNEVYVHQLPSDPRIS